MLRKRPFFLFLFAAFGLTACNVPAPKLHSIDQFSQAPVVEQVNPGAVVEIWAGNPGSLTLVATSSPVSSGSTIIRVPLSAHLSLGQVVRARQRTGRFGLVAGSARELTPAFVWPSVVVE